MGGGIFIRTLSDILGVDELQNEASFTIAPNPFTSKTNITFTNEQINSTIKITDILGNEIKTISFSGKEYTLEKDEMKAGIYFVQITDANKNMVNRKVVVE